MKNKFIKSLASKWSYYLVSIFAAVVVSFVTINIASKPKRSEIVSIFLTSYDVDPLFNEYMDRYKDDYLDSIQIVNHSIDDRNYTNYLEAFKYKMDILIVPESKLDTFHTFSFMKLNDEFVSNICSSNYEYYDFDNIHCGLKIYSNDTNEGLLDEYIKYSNDEVNENYYMFVNENSLHLGKYNNSKYEGAINVLRGLFGYEKKNG